MKIALIGYGKMGRLIGAIGLDRGHSITVTVNESHADLSADELAETLRAADVAIDFTVASAVRRNAEACMLAGIPIVVGTTGWNEGLSEISALINERGGAMVYGANFSIGVNLFYKIVEHAAELLAKFPDYEVFVEEQHHSQKKDAPSGTALKIQQMIERPRSTDADKSVRAPIASTRAGNIPGTHRVGFDGLADQILLTHSARSREGFAVGAIMAAEWVIDKKGVFEFTTVMDEMIDR